MSLSYIDHNKAAWNRMADGGSRFAKVATDEECSNALSVIDGRGWLSDGVKDLDVLCLAAGGGWQSILYAVAGARVTVVDLSGAMLKLDLREAAHRNVSVKAIEGSMDDLSMLPEAGYDIVHQPVSTCYVSDVAAVYREVARVTRDGGLYISQHKQPTSLQITRRDPHDRYVVGLEYYRSGPLPQAEDESYREPGVVEYLHRWEQLVGDLCTAGFVIEDLREPCRADRNASPDHYLHRGRFVPPYVRMKARRVARQAGAAAKSALWVP
jgi:SAM-dependent methyltransferase